MKLEERASELVKEATEIRRSLPVGSPDDDPRTLHEQMLKARAAMDRVGAVLGDMVMLRARARVDKQKAEADFEDAWNEAATKGSAFKQSEPAAQERYAHYTLEALDQKAVLRTAERTKELLEAAYEVVRVAYWGCEAARRDLDLRVRLLVTDRRLE